MSEQQKKQFLKSGRLLSISQASRFSPYSPAYLSLRARSGKLKAVKIGHNWLTTREAVVDYTQLQYKRHFEFIKRVARFKQFA